MTIYVGLVDENVDNKLTHLELSNHQTTCIETPLRHANAETYVPLPRFLSSASDFKGLNVCIEGSWFEAID